MTTIISSGQTSSEQAYSAGLTVLAGGMSSSNSVISGMETVYGSSLDDVVGSVDTSLGAAGFVLETGGTALGTEVLNGAIFQQAGSSVASGITALDASIYVGGTLSAATVGSGSLLFVAGVVDGAVVLSGGTAVTNANNNSGPESELNGATMYAGGSAVISVDGFASNLVLSGGTASVAASYLAAGPQDGSVTGAQVLAAY